MKEYLKIKQILVEADAIVIGAGAGLSNAAGLDYGTKHFAASFPELVQKYQMTDMYSSSFYPFETEEERWSYWAKHINYLYNVSATKLYQDLYSVFKDYNYFVITTNVDGQFLKAGFAPDKVFEVQGSLSKLQCSVGCHQKLYDALPLVQQMLKKEQDCKIPSSLVPYCPKCGQKMEVNLRKDAFFVEDHHWHEMAENYEHFINQYKQKKIVFIELGVGFNTPGIIRFSFEQMTYEFTNATLIRVNDRYPEVAYEIQDKAISLTADCASFIMKYKRIQ